MHTKVAQKYKEADYESWETANEATIRIFSEKVKEYKKPVTKEINGIYRLKHNGKEYFYYHQTTRSTDDMGNEFSVFETKGRYQLPHFSYNYDPNSGQRLATGIHDHETVYELEWPKDFTPELQALCSENLNNLTVITQGRKYGGFSLHGFKEESFDDLVTIGKFGTKNPVMKNQLKKKESKA